MIGKMEKVELRKVWEKEAESFTPWLYENLEVLGEELGFDLTPENIEEPIGPFYADIIAEDENGNKVLIENQLEKTDHKHLGQILTYVTNSVDVKIAIWISSDPCAQHVQAVEWLNENSPINFYLIKLEAYRIDDSKAAPKFTLITGPSENTKFIYGKNKERAEKNNLRYEFWELLLEKSKEKTNLHAGNNPSVGNYIEVTSGGLKFSYFIGDNEGRVEFRIYRDMSEGGKRNKQIFDELEEHKAEIEKDFGGELFWERSNDDTKLSHIGKRIKTSGLKDKDKWTQLQDEMIDAMIRLEKALKKHIEALKI